MIHSTLKLVFTCLFIVLGLVAIVVDASPITHAPAPRAADTTYRLLGYRFFPEDENLKVSDRSHFVCRY
jgi:hypothetical protein